MKKIPVEQDVEFDFKVTLIDKTLAKSLAVINKVFQKENFMNRLSLLEKAIENLRKVINKLEKRRTELLEKKMK